MATDFNYGNKTINAAGPIKPSGRNMPADPRTIVNLYADIPSIPGPFVGMNITVLQDETNDNKMTDYKVKSLKANTSGIANSLVDEVERMVDYLGASTGGGTGGSSVTVVDNLNSTSTTSALSANQGRVIKSSLDNITTRVNDHINNHPNGNLDDYYNKSKTDALLSTKRSTTTLISMNDLSDGVKSAMTGNAPVTIGSSIKDFYNSTKGGKKIVMLGDSTVISGANGGAINERFALYQATGQCLENCIIQNSGAIGKTLNSWVTNEMSGVISNSAGVDLYIFCLGINDLMNLNRTEEQISTDFKNAIDGLLEGTNAYILLRLPCINQAKPEWQQILRRIYMSYAGYDKRIDVIDIPLLTAYETNSNMFLADNVHPTTEGYYMIVDEIVGRICNLNTKLVDSEKSVLFKAYITSINFKTITVISSNDFSKLYQIGTLYINNIPYQYTGIVKISQNKFQITLSNNYVGIIGIVRILGNTIDNISNALDVNPNNWFTCGNPKERLWFSIPIPSSIQRSSNLKLTVSCSGYGLGGGNLRLTSILRTNPTNTTDQQYGSSSTRDASADNNLRINNFYLSSSVTDDGIKQYVICSLDVLNITDYENVRLGNFKFKINDIDVNLDTFNFVNCGTPLKATAPIMMTHDSVIQLLVNLGLLTKESYKMLPNTIINSQSSEKYGEIILNKESTTIVEGGTDTFTVKLNEAPTNNQVINLNTDNPDVSLNPSILTFTSLDWNVEQTVTINVAEDNTDYSNESCIVTLSSPNVTSKTVTIDITDNDTAPTNVPVQSVSLPPTLTVTQGGTNTLTATITPSEATNKKVSWEVDNSNCSITGSGLTVTVNGTTVGSSIITATTEDGVKTAQCNITIEAIQSSSGLVENGLILNLDAMNYSGNTSNWTDKTGTFGNIPLTNFSFDSSDGWTGTTLKLAKATSTSKNKINSNISIPNLTELDGITFEVNYKCDTSRISSNMKTPILTLPCDIRLSEVSNSNSGIYFENYSNMKIGTIDTNDASGGFKNIIIVFDTKNGSHNVYLDGLKVLSGTGSVNGTNLAKTSFILKEAFGFNFEIGSIRIYNRLLSESEINQNNLYEKSLNR